MKEYQPEDNINVQGEVNPDAFSEIDENEDVIKQYDIDNLNRSSDDQNLNNSQYTEIEYIDDPEKMAQEFEASKEELLKVEREKFINEKMAENTDGINVKAAQKLVNLFFGFADYFPEFKDKIEEIVNNYNIIQATRMNSVQVLRENPVLHVTNPAEPATENRMEFSKDPELLKEAYGCLFDVKAVLQDMIDKYGSEKRHEKAQEAINKNDKNIDISDVGKLVGLLIVTRDHIDCITDADYKENAVNFPTLFSAFGSTAVDMIQPKFKNEETNEYEIDVEKGKKLLEETEFMTQIIEQNNFYQKQFRPIVRKREEGTITANDAIRFDNAYRKHLEEQRRIFRKIKKYTKDDPILKGNATIDTVNQFEMDWKGERFGDLTLNNIEIETGYLDRGWPAEDCTLLRALELMYSALKRDVNNEDLPSAERKEAKKILEAFEKPFLKIQNSFVVSEEIRDNLLDGVAKSVKDYNAYFKKANERRFGVNEKIQIGDFELANMFETAQNRRVFASQLGRIPTKLYERDVVVQDLRVKDDEPKAAPENEAEHEFSIEEMEKQLKDKKIKFQEGDDDDIDNNIENADNIIENNNIIENDNIIDNDNIIENNNINADKKSVKTIPTVSDDSEKDAEAIHLKEVVNPVLNMGLLLKNIDIIIDDLETVDKGVWSSPAFNTMMRTLRNFKEDMANWKADLNYSRNTGILGTKELYNRFRGHCEASRNSMNNYLDYKAEQFRNNTRRRNKAGKQKVEQVRIKTVLNSVDKMNFLLDHVDNYLAEMNPLGRFKKHEYIPLKNDAVERSRDRLIEVKEQFEKLNETEADKINQNKNADRNLSGYRRLICKALYYTYYIREPHLDIKYSNVSEEGLENAKKQLRELSVNDIDDKNLKQEIMDHHSLRLALDEVMGKFKDNPKYFPKWEDITAAYNKFVKYDENVAVAESVTRRETNNRYRNNLLSDVNKTNAVNREIQKTNAFKNKRAAVKASREAAKKKVVNKIPGK